MKQEQHYGSLFKKSIHLLTLCVLWTAASCIVAKLPIEDRLCGPSGECLDGYVCYQSKCVLEDNIPKADGNPTDNTPTDGGTEPVPEVPKDQTPDVATPDDAGPVDVPPDIVPDQATGPNCSVFTKVAQQPNCNKNTNLDCYKMKQKFATSKESLPEGIAGGAAATNDNSWKAINNDERKVYVYLAGGGDKGVPGSKVFYMPVARDGEPGGWKATSPLKSARTNATAFFHDGYLYIAGGVGVGQTPISQVERAKLKADGSLEAFEDAGKLSNPRAGMGVSYQHGYIYTAGGKDAGGTAVTSVERVLILPDGSLGTPETLDSFQSLPAAQVGTMVSNHYFVYHLGTEGSNKLYFSRILGNGKLAGWCENTPLPSEIKTTGALLDARFLILFGIELTNNSLDKRVFLSSLKGGSGVPRGGGVQEWICSDASNAEAVLTQPRKQAAAVVARDRLFVIGGVDGGGASLSSVESLQLEFRSSTCDLDADVLTNFGTRDNCANVYNPNQKNLCDDKLRTIPGGSFQRGDGKVDTPKKTINLDAMSIDLTEVTNKDYAACVTDGKCTEPASKAVGTITDYYDNPMYENYPVVNVSWKQALAYCQFKGKRLPSEAEWEKAARGLTSFIYPWGNDSPTCAKANLSTCPDPGPKEVGILPSGASPYGIQNMASNVREWVGDYFDKDYFKNSTETLNPTGPQQGTTRVIKGSSFKTTGQNVHEISRRESATEETTADDLGFRCAISIYPTAP